MNTENDAQGIDEEGQREAKETVLSPYVQLQDEIGEHCLHERNLPDVGRWVKSALTCGLAWDRTRAYRVSDGRSTD